MAIDFLIPARNAEGTLGDTLASLRAQTVRDWRAIVVDDASTDRTAAVVLASGDDRIRVIRGPGHGVASARNTAFDAANSPLTCFLDADDVIDARFIERMTDGLGPSDVVACAYTYAGPGLERSDWVVTPGPSDHAPARLAELNPFSIGAIVFRRAALSLVRSAGPLFPQQSRHEDWEMLLRVSASGARWASTVPEPLFTYRLRPDSRTTGLRAMWIDGLAVIDRHHPERSAVGPAQRRWTLRSLARAVVRDDHSLAGEMMERLISFTAGDDGIFAGALRWAIHREVVARAIIDPGPVGLASMLARFIPADRAAALAARAADPAGYWARVASAITEQFDPSRRLVIFGMGRNGRELAERLAARGVEAAWVDEHLPAASDPRRMSLAALGPSHTVIVTPDERAGFLARLLQTGAEIWLPEQLAIPPVQGCAA